MRMRLRESVSIKDIDIKLVVGILLIPAIGYVSELHMPNQEILQKGLWIILALLGLAAVYTKRYQEDAIQSSILIAIQALPFICAFAYTFILYLFKEDQLGIVKQAFTTSGFLVVDALMVVGLMLVYREQIITIITYGIAVSYAITIGYLCGKIGFFKGIYYLLDRGAFSHAYDGWMEMHDVGVAVVPVILCLVWLILEKDTKIHHKYFKIALMVLVMLLCDKRSAYIGLLVGFFVLAGFRLLRKYSGILHRVISGTTIFASFFYIVFIRLGWIRQIANHLGINSMGRLEVYSWFDNQYNISPLYMGKGFQYVHRYMLAGLGSELVNAFKYLHNSILQIFIETGFWGFVLWFGFLAVAYPYIVGKKMNTRAKEFVVILFSAMIMMFCVDNILTYPLYQVTMMSMIAGVFTLENRKMRQQKH